MHLLQQHIIDIQCTSQSFGKEVQSTLSDVLEKEFYPKLEVLLDKYSLENYTWKIEHLLIQLPDISKKEWKKELVTHSLTQIEKYLKDHFEVISFNKSEESLKELGFETQPVYAESLLFEYLKTGIIAENTFFRNANAIIKSIKISDAFIKRLLTLLYKNRKALIRYYFNIPKACKIIINDRLVKFDMPEKFIIFLCSKTKFSTVEELENHIEKLRLYSENKKYNNSITAEEKDNPNFHSNTKKQKKQEKQQEEQVKWTNGSDKETTNRNVQKAIERKEISEENKETYKKADVYIENAGLIIVHPFLPNLFQKLGLYNGEDWTDRKSRHKAVLLTQYLVTGQDVFFENELMLNKLLCGFYFDDVINTKQKISKVEKEICNALLLALIEHWKVLKGSSFEALRETFLQRPGKLSVSELQSELWVEEKGVDVLISGLPWGIGMIQTPWMKDFLHCYWN